VTFPTPYPDVNTLLGELFGGMQAILGNCLVGLYLNGSLALDDFDPEHSDIDFIAAIEKSPSGAMFDQLVDMHRHITYSGRPYATELEGSYFPLPALRRHDPVEAIFPNLERGLTETLQLKEHHSDWVIQRHIVRESGIGLFGPPPETLIDPVSPDELRQATVDVLRFWWATPAAIENIRLNSGYQVYSVQTMCRSLYTLKHGSVASKRVACQWASGEVPAKWSFLIQQAVQWQLGPDTIEETVDFIAYILDVAGTNF
jgi:hypothetical protein